MSAKSAKCLSAAVALWLATDNFSQAKLWEAAHEGLDAILARAAAIQEAEAERRLDVKAREAKYQRIACHAAVTSDITESELIDILRNFDMWEYRMLCEAQRQDERRPANAAEAN